MKNIIEKTVLGAALVLAVFVGPALSSSGTANQQAAGVIGIGGVVAALPDYSTLDPLNRDQLISVIKCLTDGRNIQLQKCVTKLAPPPATSTPATLTASYPSTLLRATNIRISSHDRVSAILNTFDVKSEMGTAKITSITSNASGTLPTTVHLFDGATLIKSKSMPASGQVTFDDTELLVAKDTRKTLTIKADFAANTPSAGRAVMLGITSLTYDRGNGKTATLSTGLWGPTHRLFGAVLQYKIASTPTITGGPYNGVGIPTLVATFPMTVQAVGGDGLRPHPDDFRVSFMNANGIVYSNTTKNVVIIPNNDIADGSTANVTLVAQFNQGAVAGKYWAKMNSIFWSVRGQSPSTIQTWGLEDFVTPNQIQFNP